MNNGFITGYSTPCDLIVFEDTGIEETTDFLLKEANSNQFRYFFNGITKNQEASLSTLKSKIPDTFIIISNNFYDDLLLKYIAKDNIEKAINTLKNNQNLFDKILSPIWSKLSECLNNFIDEIDYIGTWKDPYLNLDEEGNIEASWWMGSNELHLFISEESEYYTQVWGENIYEHMIDGKIEKEEIKNLWNFLLQGKKIKQVYAI